MNKNQQLRIIGGQWRSRQLQFPKIDTIRPTPNRVRETLFNWLQPVISNSDCLDLFAGSGALGFEASSRYAKSVVMVDNNRQIISYLQQQIKRFAVDSIQVYYGDAALFCQQTSQIFDLIFLDPPFQQHWIPKICFSLEDAQMIRSNGKIYVETELAPAKLALPKHWQIVRQQQAGQVYYYLLLRK